MKYGKGGKKWKFMFLVEEWLFDCGTDIFVYSTIEEAIKDLKHFMVIAKRTLPDYESTKYIEGDLSWKTYKAGDYYRLTIYVRKIAN